MYPELRYYRNHRDERLVHMHDYKERIRKEVLSHYGGKCSCCGYDDMNKKIGHQSFLQIDLIDGGHKKLKSTLGISGSSSTFQWLRKNGFPSGYRVLCAGCNVSMEPNQLKCELHK